MHFEFNVSVEVERTQGKFASRDELEAQLLDALEGSDPGSVDGDEGGEYEVTDWAVEAVVMDKKKKAEAAPLSTLVPELKALTKAWYWLGQNPDDEKVQATFEQCMETVFQMVGGQ